MARRRKGTSAELVAEVRELFTGEVWRWILGIVDVGEIILSELSDAVETVGTNRFLRVRATAPDGHRVYGNLFTAGNVIWRKPKKGDQVAIVRSGNMDHTSAIALHGDGGTDNDVPSELTDSNTVISPPTGDVLVKSRDGDAQLDAPTSGKKVKLGAGGQPVVRKGDRQSASAAMAQWMSQVESAINSISAGAVSPLSTIFATVGAPPLTGVGIAKADEGSDKAESE